MSEIGGYFSLEEFEGEEYYSDLLAVNSVRNGLAYLIEKLKIKRIWLPYFLCDSIHKICKMYNLKCSFYEINYDFKPLLDCIPFEEGDYLYLVNYYGQLDEETIKKYKREYCNIILDNTQAFFSKFDTNIVTLYNCRKYFGVPDGAYVSGINSGIDELQQDISYDRMKYLLGRYEIGASEFFEEYHYAEDQFDNMDIRYMSKLTHNLLRAINYDSVKKKRENNYKIIHNKLALYNMLVIKCVCGPYAYPFMHPNAPQIRKQLISHKIYVPVLWPEVIKKNESNQAVEFAKNILPLPVDQRYTGEDMNLIIDIICKNI